MSKESQEKLKNNLNRNDRFNGLIKKSDLSYRDITDNYENLYAQTIAEINNWGINL